MDSTEDLDYPQIIFQYSNGFLVSKVMFTACELGVFDLLLESGQPLSLDVIAARLGTSIMGMERLLDACVGLKLLAVELRREGAFYRNTEISNIYLTKSSPKSQYHIMMYYSNTVYLCWHYLTDAVREGRNQYERAFGISSEDLFGAMYRSEEEMLKFLAGQNSIWSICGRDVLTAFDLSPFTQIYDLGGGGGALAQECVFLYPNCTVTVYDLPKVVQVAKERLVPPEERRIAFHEGDFFKDSIPEADLYILSKILHDWNDEKCGQLLAEVYKACRPGGGVLLVESLLRGDRSGPVETQLYSLNMLVQTEGKERTAAEYSELLGAAGFRDVRVRRTGKIYDAVLGRK
ncbi:acetylserotonin O-methyltransferase isoform X1 [Lagopus leucura]|uniref:acetylserotonin O-methyltransferase isoform X1 n=2 Tax=Lagopus leucura TaxID=30410 RepID=UPI001C683703|nr:acetylserotonin O-methyltransferase isoform X1 [Lagopus leucura]XP_042722907.1 acetylserotonin O-methyltransferase isoform X1 [Lagopus leucura]XP_042722908.1 acetylserotonin O-methyltransferase isoform X1 [Lagopus leucura]